MKTLHSNNTLIRIFSFAFLFVLILSLAAVPALAEETGATGEATETVEAGKNENDVKSSKAFAAALTVAVAASVGAIAMGIAIVKAVDGIARQPEADGKIRTSLMLGLVFVETAIIYALIVAVLIIFVL